MSVLRQHLRSPSEAEDLCQNVFLALRDMAPRIRPNSSVRGLLVGIAVRKAKKFGAVAWVRKTLLERNQPSHDAGGGEAHLRVDAGHDAQRMLESLPEGWRTVVVLNLVEGWTAEEIAASLGISPNTVFTRIFRARQQLRAQWPDAEGMSEAAHE